MPMKRHMPGGRATALLMAVLLLLGGPAMPHVSAHTPTTAAPRAGAAAATPLTAISVTGTADLADGNTASFDALAGQPGPDGLISLREALLAANATPGTTPLTIGFAIPTSDRGYSSASGTWTISLGARALPNLARGSLTIAGDSQPGGAAGHPSIVIDGYQVYEAPGLSNGLTITSAQNSIRGLTLVSFYDDAIVIDGPAAALNQVAGCYVGVGAAGGPAAAASYFGIEIRNGAHDNLIGGASPAARNLIGGNEHSGILVQGAGTRANTIANNWIGTDASGQARLANKVAGIMISGGARDTLVGGANQGNLVSGNDIGVYLDGAVDTTVAGNVIGLAADGHTPLGNQSGGVFVVRGAQNNRIGGPSPVLRNVISGNGAVATAFGQGIYMSDTSTTGNLVLGNYIGTDTSGNGPAGNYRQGLLITAGAQANQVGDTTAAAGNVIAYNGLGGIRIDAPNNRVLGNLIGVGADGHTRLGNQSNGVRIGGNDNTLGPNNLIANNQHSGVLLLGSNTTVMSNTLEANGRSGLCAIGRNATIDRNLVVQNGGGAGPWAECAIRGGIVISDTSEALLTNNQVFSNLAAGVTVFSGSANRILSNSISDNQGLGIQLLGGGNGALDPPQLGKLAGTIVSGSSCSACRIELFTDSGDEGRYYVGMIIAGGNGAFALQLDSGGLHGPYLTATQTDALGNTSAFSPPIALPDAAPTPTPPPDQGMRLFVPLIGR